METNTMIQNKINVPFPLVTPWHEAVDPAELLTAISHTIHRFIVCPPETVHAATLWIAMTWFIEVVQVAPMAIITAPEKRCGKSQFLFLLGRMVNRPFAASNITPAALFRSIDLWQPTLLIVEADTFIHENLELRGLLNCGHSRELAKVVRVVGDKQILKCFYVWGAKALAGIGRLADTLVDRAISLELRRKLPYEKTERFRHAEPELFETLAKKLARFAQDYAEQVRIARPHLPEILHDRAQDNWEPLLAIADIAGGEWPKLALLAALKLSKECEQTHSNGIELLIDIRDIFDSKCSDRISTADLIMALCVDEEKRWATYNRGFQIKPRQLANLLKEFGINSNTIRLGVITIKGYFKSQFLDVFSKYLEGITSTSVTTSHESGDSEFSITDL